MNESALQTSEFDEKLKRLVSQGNSDNTAQFLTSMLTKKHEPVTNRKYTIRNVLGSDVSIFKRVFCSLDCNQFDEFLLPRIVNDALTTTKLASFDKMFELHMADPTVKYYRIDGRRRLFVDKEKFSDSELALFGDVMSHFDELTNDSFIEKVLFESISPTDFDQVSVDNWHFDCLKDQIKVVIPLSDIGPDNAPMRIANDVGGLQQYPQIMWEKFHNAFKISGMEVGASNYVEASIAAQMGNIHGVVARRGDLIAFNPKVIHTGTLCKRGQRNSITLYLNKNSLRNKKLNLLF